MAYTAKVSSERITDVQHALGAAQIQWSPADSSYMPPPTPSGIRQETVQVLVDWGSEEDSLGKLEAALRDVPHLTKWEGQA